MGQTESSPFPTSIAPIETPNDHLHISRKEMRKELRRIKLAHKQEQRYSRLTVHERTASSNRNGSSRSLPTRTSQAPLNYNPPLSHVNSSPTLSSHNRGSTSTTKRVVMSEESLSLELEEMGFSRAVICDVLRELTSNANSTRKIVEPNHLIEKLMEETRRRFGEDAVTSLQSNTNDDDDTSEEETPRGNSSLDFPNTFHQPVNLATTETTMESPNKAPLEQKDFLQPQLGQNININTKSQIEVDYCKVCMDREIDSVILRCGHVATCLVCSKKLKRCPICARNITEIIKIYRS